MLKILSTTLLIVSLLYHGTSDLASHSSLDEVNTPPGTIQISDNFYFDKGEITNFNWMEYLYWVKTVYGENSEELKNATPNNKVWSTLNENYSALDSSYLRHPAYRDYPVVGISYQQAVDFSQWRSDRVMEYYLINKKIIASHKVTNKDSIFTIEKYFNGQYLDYKPSEKVQFYPQYSLPDSLSYYKFSHFADSINALNYKSCKKGLLSEHLLIECNCLENNTNKTDSLPYGPNPTKSVDISNCRKELVAHLKGNIREMTDVKGVFYGLSFIDSCDEDYNKCRVDTDLVNSYTGFRNICRYKEWGK